MHTKQAKKMFRAMWLFALGASLLALTTSLSAQEWGWSGMMVLLTEWNVFMLYLNEKSTTENE